MEQKHQNRSKISVSLTQSLSSDKSVTSQWELFRRGRRCGGGGRQLRGACHPFSDDSRVHTHTHIIVIVVIVIAWPPSAPSPTQETPTKKHFAGALRFCLF